MEQRAARATKQLWISTSLVAALTIAAVLALLSGVGDARAHEEASVSIVHFAFEPGTIEVAAGTTVTWAKTGDARHTVTADDGSFDPGTIESGGAFGQTFDAPPTGAASTFEDEPRLGLPDLVITGITYERQYWSGLVYDLHVTVKNQGSAGSGLGGFCVEVRLAGDALVGICKPTGIPAGSSVVIQNLDVFASVACGQRLLVVADSETDVVESSESNNSRWWSAPSCS